MLKVIVPALWINPEAVNVLFRCILPSKLRITGPEIIGSKRPFLFYSGDHNGEKMHVSFRPFCLLWTVSLRQRENQLMRVVAARRQNKS